jgi:hypothetical protein
MSLSEGDPAYDGDIWFRVVTNQEHIKRGRVHHSAFGGNAITASDKKRPWARELSGRLRSLAGDVEQEAIAYCREMTARGGGEKSFHGVIYARVAGLKLTYEHDHSIKTAVYFTPLGRDPAHADFTFSAEWPNDEKERMVHWLSDRFEGLHPAQIHHLPQPECKPLIVIAADAIRGIVRKVLGRKTLSGPHQPGN